MLRTRAHAAVQAQAAFRTLAGQIRSGHALAVTAALISAIAVLAGAVVTAFVGPAWKLRADRRRETRDIVDRYSRPLLQAAFELQSRLYNIARLDFFIDAWRGSDEARRWYAETSTLWVFGQYLGWIEILRREVQFLDLGDIALTRELRQRLLDVSDHLATDRHSDPLLQIFRSDQRAIGDRMIVRRVTDTGGTRSDCLGYAEFRDALGDPSFARWFDGLRNDIGQMTTSVPPARLFHVQRALIDLVDLLDEDRSVFPDPNVRGKLPDPGDPDKQDDAPAWQKLANFTWDVGWEPFDDWVHEENLEPDGDEWSKQARAKRRRTAAVLVAEARRDERSLDIRGWVEPPAWTCRMKLAQERLPLAAGGWRFARSRARERRRTNRLLKRYGRPPVI